MTTAPDSDRIYCENPDPDKQGTTIPSFKYRMVRDAIIRALSEHPDGLTSSELMVRVRERLDADEIERLGSVSWHTTVVKLHLEAISELERDSTVRPPLMRLPPSG